MHFDIRTEDGLTIRLSISNLFKTFKRSNTAVQFPFNDTTNKVPNGGLCVYETCNASSPSGWYLHWTQRRRWITTPHESFTP